MRVLGISPKNDGGAAIVEDGRILAAVNEERLARMKLVVGFPRRAIREVLRMTGTAPDDLAAVLIATKRDGFIDELRPFNGLFEGRHFGPTSPVKKMAARFGHLRDSMPWLEGTYYALQAPLGWHRRWRIRSILRGEFGLRCPLRYVDHHLAHVTSAYFTSGYRDALTVSIDGGGDERSALVHAVRDGRFEQVTETSAYHSLGNYYAYITRLCGFKAHKHEGKITGLSAHGEPRYLPLLREFIDERDGSFVNHGGVVSVAAIEALREALPPDWTRRDLAASIQRHTEDLVTRYVQYWRRRTGLRNIALAGGVAANVRVNDELHALAGVDSIFIHPHMSDGGLSVGSALAASLPGVLETPMEPAREPIPDVYLGPSLDDAEIRTALEAANLHPEPLDRPLEEEIAARLVEGYVVARAAGRMEYGPRALGNRSILYQPTDPAVNDWLNANLRRTEFMPFAPSVLYQARDRCFEGVDGAEHAAEFMTITFRCTPWMRRHMPGVVHVDGTARPQLVRHDRNPGYYRIIDAFRRRTGLPGIINTSFNMHEEPIVCSARDAVRAFIAGKLDYLAIGPYLVKHPQGVAHPLKPVRPVGEAITT